MQKVRIGKIVGTHALKGELKIRSLSDFNEERFKKGKQVFVSFDNRDISFIIATVRMHKGNYLVSFENHQDINLVEKYIGSNVFANKEEIELEDDEYYVEDILQCSVYTKEKCLGKVIDIIDNGRHDILVIDYQGKRVSIPYVEAFVKEEDIENKRIVVELIKGMIDED